MTLIYIIVILSSAKSLSIGQFKKVCEKQTDRADIRGSGGTIILLALDFSVLKTKYLQQSEILSWVDLGCILEGMSILASVKQYNCCIHFL